MTSQNLTKNLPTLLVIADPDDEDWISLCSSYKNKINIEQTTWDRISLVSYSDQKYPVINLAPLTNAKYDFQKKFRNNIKPSLVLIRNLARAVGGKLGIKYDFRNILYGFYHANIPMINDINTIFAELEKPIMYGRLRKIRDEVGEKNFPLIQQYYYPDHKEIIFTPKIPYVLKVSYPHAGYGKIRVKENDDTIDLASIIALHNDYSAAEPLIDVDYELRIVFIAPNYYRVHKRQSMNWKVNFLMTNVREDCEMSINYKKWVDLIYKNYPDMEIFDIDALVDKNGKEYILEVNGSTQGFSPEHGDQDLEYMKNFVLRKLEIICGMDILEEGNEMKLYFKKDKVVELSDEEKDIKIVNLKNEVSDLEKKCREFEEKYENLKKEIMEEKKFNFCDILDNKKWIVVFISVVVLIIGIGLIRLYRK